MFHKTHLLPFGEFLPFREWVSISALGSAVSGAEDFTKGTGPYTVRFGDHPAFSPLICYEVAFPTEVADPDDRPEWLLNVGNDGWFGRTIGPYQHLATAQARTIEQGLPMARVNGTGVSAVIDPYGRILARIGLYEAGKIDIHLPTPLPRTPYSWWSDTVFFLMLGLLFLYVYLVCGRGSSSGRHAQAK
jgi:apolipoprotein N-acyltransferase